MCEGLHGTGTTRHHEAILPKGPGLPDKAALCLAIAHHQLRTTLPQSLEGLSPSSQQAAGRTTIRTILHLQNMYAACMSYVVCVCMCCVLVTCPVAKHLLPKTRAISRRDEVPFPVGIAKELDP
jgi:hypothetical protein